MVGENTTAAICTTPGAAYWYYVDSSGTNVDIALELCVFFLLFWNSNSVTFNNVFKCLTVSKAVKLCTYVF